MFCILMELQNNCFDGLMNGWVQSLFYAVCDATNLIITM